MHEPNRSSSEGEYIGRDKIRNNLLAILNDGRGKSGTYLISGYRGSGKTSFVKTVLHDYEYGTSFTNFKKINDIFFYWSVLVGFLKVKSIKCCLYRVFKIFKDLFRLVDLMLGWALILFLLVLIIFSPPSESLCVNYGCLFLIILGFLFFSKIRRDGVVRAVKLEKSIIYGFFRPMVRVNINLGHESLDAKTLLFNMASLLRTRCRESKAKLIYIIIIVFVFYFSAMTAKKYTDIISGHVNSYVFSVYYLDDTLKNVIFEYKEESNNYERNARYSSDECVKRVIDNSLRDFERKLEEQKKYSNATPGFKEQKTYSNATPECKEQKTYSNATPEFKEQKTYSNDTPDFYENIYLSEDAARNRLYELNNGLLLEKKEFQIFNRKIQFLLDAAKTNSHFIERDRVDAICKVINHVKDQQAQNIIDSANFLHVSYCFLNFIDQRLIYYLNYDKRIFYLNYYKQMFYYSFGVEYDEFGDIVKRASFYDVPIFNFIQWFHIGTFELFSIDNTEGYSPPQNFIFIFIFLMGIVIAYFLYRLTGFRRFIKKLDYIHERVIYSTSTERNTSPLPWFQSFLFRKMRTTEPLDTRQVEELLLDALEYNRSIFRLMPQADIIFIFDELDKITPQTQENRFTTSQIDQARQRKQQIEALLGSLKNFITIAPARFIFIGGRDMYDTNLVEQISPNRIHGSMFDAIIYVPSFLTDDSDGVGEDISSMIEQYVCRRLLPSTIACYLFRKKEKRLPKNSYESWSLELYKDFLKDVLKVEDSSADELVNFLQKFIYYLTYRSAGCVQRLSYHFERFFETNTTVINSLFDYKELPDAKLATNFYLGFDERQQYKVEMIANLFIILHAEANQLVRQFGDKLMLSTFSLLDYIFKYHNMGFNSLDIERAPEMLDIYRTPSLPGLIDYFLNQVLKPYLHPIKNGLFEYRFVHSFQAEIAYISYFSEQEMAAFNFSLDESIHTKQHFNALLKTAKSDTPEHLRQVEGSILLESDVPVALPFIHQSLGDLYFLDKQYPEALMEYRLALQYLAQAIDEFQIPFKDIQRSKDQNYNPYPLKNYTFLIIAYLRISLKMILASEIRKQYDYAAALCSQAERTVQHFMDKHLGKRFFMPNIAMLPLIVQPYLCLAFLHLKMNPASKNKINLIEHIIERINENFKNASVEGSNTKTKRNSAKIVKSKFKAEAYDKNRLLAYVYMKAGDLSLAASDFDQKSETSASSFYKKALGLLVESEDLVNNSNVLSDIGYTLINLGNILFVNLSSEDAAEKINANCVKEGDFKELKESIEEISKDIYEKKLEGILNIYCLSAKTYELAGRHADAFMAYWSFLFLCVYTADDKRACINPIKEKLKAKMEELDKLTFKHGYGLDSDKHESPYLKNANVLFAYLERKDDEIKIRGLNGFPIETKILAYYLKAKLIKDKVDKDKVDKDLAIDLYIRAIEESMVYIGTQEYIFPHPALMYDGLLSLLDNDFEKNKKLFENDRNQKGINKNLEKYLNKSYCETQRNILSNKMINRHKPSEDFYKYMEKKYYLNDSFSDPYLNTLWVADYILSLTLKRE